MAEECPEGTIKRDPVTGACAIRTNQPGTPPQPWLPSLAWLMATTNQGAHPVPADAIADWEVIYEPPREESVPE